MRQYNELPVAIIGGGSVGLAAAAHLVAKNESFILFETGKNVGHNMLDWGHVRVFSPWRYNIDKTAETLLTQNGWQTPNKEYLPLGREIVEDYLRPLANLPQLKPHIHLDTKVVHINRKGFDKVKTWGREERPFAIRVKQGNTYHTYEAKAVIDASGTWQNANPIGSGGVSAINEEEFASRIFYGIPDVLGKHKNRYANKSTVVVGGGHSAINSLLDLNKLVAEFPETKIHWILRKDNVEKTFGGGENDGLEARGALGTRMKQLVDQGKVQIYTPFHIDEIKENEQNQLTIVGWQNDELKGLEGIDEVIANTGARPDFSFLREVRYASDPSLESVPALADLIDPNIHSCGTVRPHGEAELKQPEKDFYIVGVKSYGRAPTFLMTTGYEQVRSVVAALTGDFEAAKKVELDLPETGVCSVNIPQAKSASSSCCGTEENKEPAATSCGTSEDTSCGSESKEPAPVVVQTGCCS